jgi:hypothetical protein
MAEEKEMVNFEASGTNISIENVRLTLKTLLKTLEDYRDNLPFDFHIKIVEKKET